MVGAVNLIKIANIVSKYDYLEYASWEKKNF